MIFSANLHVLGYHSLITMFVTNKRRLQQLIVKLYEREIWGRCGGDFIDKTFHPTNFVIRHSNLQKGSQGLS